MMMILSSAFQYVWHIYRSVRAFWIKFIQQWTKHWNTLKKTTEKISYIHIHYYVCTDTHRENPANSTYSGESSFKWMNVKERQLWIEYVFEYFFLILLHHLSVCVSGWYWIELHIPFFLVSFTSDCNSSRLLFPFLVIVAVAVAIAINSSISRFNHFLWQAIKPPSD